MNEKSISSRLAARQIPLIIGVVLLGLQMMRPFFVLVVNNYGEKVGLLNAAIPTLLVFLAPFALPIIVMVLKPRRTLFGLVFGLALLRMTMQFAGSPDVTLILSGIGTALSLMSWTLILIYMRHMLRLQAASTWVLGILFGLALDTAIRSVFITLDPVWQAGLISLAATLLISLIAPLTLWQNRQLYLDELQEPDLRRGLPLALLGPFVMLHLMLFQNTPFVASASGLSLALATGLVLLADALAIQAIDTFSQRILSKPIRWLAGGTLIILTTLIPSANGIVAIVMTLVAHPLASLMLLWTMSNLHGKENQHDSVWRTSIAIGMGSLLLVVPAILYFVGQNVALPFRPELMLPLSGLLLSLSAFSSQQEKHLIVLNRPVLLPILLLIVPVFLLINYPSPQADRPLRETIKVVNYNIHYGVNTDGWVDPEAIARIIEAQNPDVIMLQEVSRGWLIAGTVDLAEWLSLRLKMPYVFAPAADQQFGNVILSRAPIISSEFAHLPTGDVPMLRSYQIVTLETITDPLQIFNTHLSAWANPVDRIPQVTRIVEVWGGTPRTIIAGDMNTEPGAADIAIFFENGLISAQDEVGDPSEFTAPSFDPKVRIDWIFASDTIAFNSFEIVQSLASDHFMLLATLE